MGMSSAAAFFFADAGPGPLVYPMGGSLAVAGVFLSLAVVTGGLWLVRGWQKQPVRTPRKWFYVCLGLAGAFASVPVGVVGLFIPPIFVPAAALLVGGIVLIVQGFR
jgi:hypothetical protein